MTTIYFCYIYIYIYIYICFIHTYIWCILIQIQVVWMSLFLSTFSPWWHEERETNHKPYYAEFPHPRALHILWCLWSQLISASQDSNWSALIRSEKPSRVLQQPNLNYLSFQNSQDYLFRVQRQPPTQFTQTAIQHHFLSGGLLWQMIIVISFLHRFKSAPSDYALGQRDLSSSKSYQTKW